MFTGWPTARCTRVVFWMDSETALCDAQRCCHTAPRALCYWCSTSRNSRRGTRKIIALNHLFSLHLIFRFHGHGKLIFPNGSVFEAEWEHGKSRGPGGARGQLTFGDGLVYGEGDWDYCDADDRR